MGERHRTGLGVEGVISGRVQKQTRRGRSDGEGMQWDSLLTVGSTVPEHQQAFVPLCLLILSAV